MEKKILFVDEEEGIRKIQRIVLEDMGYEVFTAENGENALHIFRKTNPPIVITDIKMPGMDGLTLLKKIKQENQDTEVIMVTGHGDMDLAIKSLKFEATDFITKPINDEAMEIALKRARERISMKLQIRESQMVRYYGYYSNVSRGKRQKENQDGLIPYILEPSEDSRAYRKNWARLIKKMRWTLSHAPNVRGKCESSALNFKPPPRANGPPIGHHIDYAHSQFPSYDDYNVGPEYPIDTYAL